MVSVTALPERPPSLRRRLTASLAVGGGLLLGALFVALDWYIDAELYGRFDAALHSRARALRQTLDVRAHTPVEIAAEFPEYSLGNHRDFYQIMDAGGAVVARSASSRGRDLPLPSARAPSARDGRPYDVILPDGHRGRAIALSLPRFGQDHTDPRPLLMLVATERESLDRLESRLHLGLVAGTILALAVVCLIAVLVVRRGLQPLVGFSETIARRVQDPAAASVAPESLPAELAPIARTLNQAFEKLLDTLARESRLARDTAHELRTPLAELQCLVLRVQADSTEEPVRRQTTAMLQAVSGMTRAVDGLLALARCEAGIDSPEMEPVDLAGLLRRQLDLWRTEVVTRELQIAGEIPAELWVVSDVALLERILSNLVGNAVQHAPSGSEVRLILDTQHSHARLRIGNSAPRIAVEDLPQLGTRAFQATAPRDAQPHARLGLSLAHALARQLDLSLTFNLEAGELMVTLSGFDALPAGAPDSADP